MGIRAVLIAVIMISAFIASAEVEESLPATISSCELCSFAPHDLGASESSGKSELWVLDSCNGLQSDLTLPLGERAEVEISPGYSSYVMLYRRLPSGDLQTEYLGYLYKGHKYRLRFCSPLAGTHEMWYRTGWQESNRIRIHMGM